MQKMDRDDKSAVQFT